jgi:hypothetical protein
MIETRSAALERPDTVARWVKMNAMDAQRARDIASLASPALALAGANAQMAAVAMPNGDPPPTVLWGEDERL